MALWVAILFACQLSSAQSPTFNHLTVENGLSHNAVLAVTQDSRGFMWFGTQIGLNRYDGHHFKIYKQNRDDTTSISDNNIIALLADSRHNLWIGTSNGLNHYDSLKDSFERIRLNTTAAPNQSNSIFSLLEDRNKHLWIGTANGLVKLTGKEKTTLLPGKAIRCVYEDQKGFLWVGCNDGLIKIDPVKGLDKFEVFRSVASQPGSISANYITAITEDNQQRLWIGTQNSGVNLYDPATNTFAHFSHDINKASGLINNNIRKITADRSGLLWIGTQEGLSLLDPVTKKISSYRHDGTDKKSLSQNSVYSLYEDMNGSIWTGTYFGGINVSFPFKTSFHVLQSRDNSSSISNNVISSVVEDDRHNLWIGTEGGGLNYFDRSSGKFSWYLSRSNDPSSIGSNLVKSVYRDKNGNTWAGTHGGGLNLFEPATKTFKRFLFKDNDAETLNSEVLALLEDSEGIFWVGTNAGIKLFSKNNTELEPAFAAPLAGQLKNIFARFLFEDSHKQVWIGAIGGLYRVANDKLVQVCDDYINSIIEDSKGNIWAGLHYGGLAMYDQKIRSLVYYSEKDGLPNNNIIGIIDDRHDNLWLSTDNGLVKFDIAGKSFHTYTISDGLADNAFNYNSFLRDSNGQFFFGGYNGLTSFFPADIEINNYKAPIVFTGLSLFNKLVTINGNDKLLQQDIGSVKEITFRYNQDVFTIEFALLNFIKSNKNRYAYTLKGFDKTWNETNGTSATYTNLPSGNYTFIIKGANNDGIWSAPVALEINILPPFWLTWWAYCIYALLVAAIFFLVIRFFFLQALLKKEDELHQVKLNFFTNISHEIRTHLTLIMIPLEKMSDLRELSDFSRRQLVNMKDNADRLLKLVSELMDFRKAETNHMHMHVAEHDLVMYLREIYDSFNDVSLAKNITSSFTHSLPVIPLYFDEEQLSKVFFNLLSNAFKFTPAGGHVILNVVQEEDAVIVNVEDNGRGIAPGHLDKLFSNFFQVADHGIQNTGYGIGLALSKNIVELHKGTINVESRPATNDAESRTSFIVTLPRRLQHFEESESLQHAAMPAQIKLNEAIVPGEVVVNTTTDVESVTRPFTVLVVEDNAELRLLITDTLKRSYEVVECEHGEDGWKVAIEQLPDLVISDIMMPVMDGLMLCAKLKTDERTSHIPVILLTAKSSHTDLVAGLETGADVYITKPFNTKVLELNTRNLLASRERLRQKFSQRINSELQADGKTNTTDHISDVVVNHVDGEFITNVIQLVETHMDDPEFGVDMLARKVAMSQPILYRKLKAVTNMSVNDFVKTLRLKKAAQLLKQQQYTVYEVAYAVGYNDRKYFSREFKKQFGKTPSEYAGMEE